MSRKIAATIQAGPQSVSFYTDEVVGAVREPVRYHVLQSLSNALPVVRYEGDEWPVLRMRLRMVDRDTLVRLHTVQAMSGLLKVYYAMQEDAGLYLTGLLYPGSEERRFIHGLEQAGSEHVVTILESE